MDPGERADEFGYLIRDRAGQFSAAVDAVLADAGVTVCKIPPRCPRANAYAERFVRTVSSEATDRLLIFGERHLRRVLDEYARHDNGWRPHRALALQPPRSSRPVVDLTRERIRRGPVLGGLVTRVRTSRVNQQARPRDASFGTPHARVEIFHVRPSGSARAEEAVDLATACGSPKALTYALIARVMARTMAGEGGGLADAERAQTAAAQVRDHFGFTAAVMWARNSMDCTASRQVIEYLRRGREQATSLGAPHIYLTRLAALEAHELLQLGEWRACVELLRVVLGSTPGPWADTDARLTSALLACRQGRWTEAQAHLDRAEELFAELPRNPGFPFAAVRAELAVAAGDTERAMVIALAGVQAEGLTDQIERLLPLAARAAADEVQAVRDRGGDPAPAVARLLDLQRRYPTVVADKLPGPTYPILVGAMRGLYEAELLRGQLGPAAGQAWSRAAQACVAAELLWEEAYAQWRAAQTLLADRSTRDAAVIALRRAHELAVDLQAAPLLADVEALARSGGVALDAAIVGAQPAVSTLLPGLTPREREVLEYVVAGRTYRQIAGEMVISEKTVSVHISNLLRKTRTSNRIELAQLVRRLAGPPSD